MSSSPGPPPLPPHKPPALDYSNSATREPRGGAGKRFGIGLIVGTAVSLLVWFSLFSKWSNNASAGPVIAATMLSILATKYISAIIAVCFRKWRMFGAGLFTSAVLGALIFVGKCFASL